MKKSSFQIVTIVENFLNDERTCTRWSLLLVIVVYHRDFKGDIDSSVVLTQNLPKKITKKKPLQD